VRSQPIALTVEETVSRAQRPQRGRRAQTGPPPGYRPRHRDGRARGDSGRPDGVRVPVPPSGGLRSRAPLLRGGAHQGRAQCADHLVRARLTRCVRAGGHPRLQRSAADRTVVRTGHRAADPAQARPEPGHEGAHGSGPDPGGREPDPDRRDRAGHPGGRDRQRLPGGAPGPRLTDQHRLHRHEPHAAHGHHRRSRRRGLWAPLLRWYRRAAS
jgi:hypothetical protein